MGLLRVTCYFLSPPPAGLLLNIRSMRSVMRYPLTIFMSRGHRHGPKHSRQGRGFFRRPG